MNFAIKCKFGCEGGHPTAVCPKFAKAKVVARVQQIASQPVKPGTKAKAKKAKRKKGEKHGT